MKINGLQIFRYSITGLTNGAARADFGSPPAQMAATYQQLITFHQARIQRETQASDPTQILRNHLTALRSYIASIGKTESSPVGDEMSTHFNEALRAHLSTAGISTRSAADRRSMLNGWKTSFGLMHVVPDAPARGRERRRADAISEQNPFERGLKDALAAARLAPKRAAALGGTSTSAIGRWTRGALPNARSTPSLLKLEEVLNLEPGHLSRLLLQAQQRLDPASKNEFRARLNANKASGFRALRESDVSETLLEQWRTFVFYKIALRTEKLLRHPRGRWTASGGGGCHRPRPGIDHFRGDFYASANVTWNHLCSYYGFLLLPKECGGYGLAKPQVQTLAWLTVPEAIDAYLEFRTARSNGRRHAGHAVFASFVASLTQDVSGYLTQNSHLLHDLPESHRLNRDWQELCRAGLRAAKEWKRASQEVSRVVTEPIQLLLDHDAPLVPVFTAMQKLRRRSELAPAGSVDEATARRDELILGFLISNPLRSKNFVELTFFPDNTGTLYESSPGKWRIRPAKMKNRANSQANRYDVAVADWLNGLISDYVKYFRPKFEAASHSDKVFLTRRSDKMTSLGQRVQEITRGLIPGTGGFGPHAFRHLVATDWLQRNPNDFLTVALLLNDTLEVVMHTYAHLKRDQALARHSQQLATFLPDYLQLR